MRDLPGQAAHLDQRRADRGQGAPLDHMGILVQPKYIIYDYLATGRLVPVLDDWELPILTMNIAFQTRIYMPTR